MSRAVFGRALAATTIERGVEVTLRYYLGMYLGEVLEQNGYPRDGLRDPLDLERVVDLNDYSSAAQIALMVVASPGTTDTRQDADGYTGVWDVRAGAIVDLGNRLDTREAAQLYAAAAGLAVSHQGVATVQPDRRTGVRDEYDGHLLPLEGSTVSWAGERFRAVDRMRGLVAGEALFRVTVEGARSLQAADLEPPGEPQTPTDRDAPPDGVPAPVTPSLTIDRRTPTED